MRILCGDGILDLDKYNEFLPDGKNVYCQVGVSNYDCDAKILEGMSKYYFKTADNGVVYISNIIFKLLLDMSVKCQLDNVRYLVKEMDRGVAAVKRDMQVNQNTENQELDESKIGLMVMDKSNLLPVFLKVMHRGSVTEYIDKDSLDSVNHVYIRNIDKVVNKNLDIIHRYDMVGDWAKNMSKYDSEYAQAYCNLIGFINDYIYLTPENCTFMGIYLMLLELFKTLDIEDCKIFIDNFYKMLDKVPGVVYAEKVDEVTQRTPDVADSTFDDKSKAIAVKEIKRITGCDITGQDNTYSVNYCEAFYDKELENADSEGFLEKVIASRVNGTAAPIDLLSEAVKREHSGGNTTTNILRSQLSDMRESISEIVKS